MTTSRSWPEQREYDLALQNPQGSFTDPELRSGSVSTNNRGLPVGIRGKSAIVYRVQSTRGVVFAARCFISQPRSDQQQRYGMLSDHLHRVELRGLGFTRFSYLPEGVLIAGRPYPVVKMDYVDGQRLSNYIEGCLRLNRIEVLHNLAEQWTRIIAGLAAARVAHGDLEHGNILVNRLVEIKLVDYDGVFVPALRNSPPGESGHRNYQHPRRTAYGYYQEDADNFAALVIYLSMKALAADPDLWRQFHTADNLIFSEDDFKAPGISPIWGQLNRSREPEVPRLAESLAQFSRGPVAAATSLETVLRGLAVKKASISSSPVQSTSAPAVAASTRASTSPGATSIQCPNCAQVNKPDEIYCQSCAHQLCGSLLSPCNHTIPVKALYCSECGTKQ